MGIAPGTSDTAACGITRVGATGDVGFEFDVADCEMFVLGAVDVEELKLGELDTGVLALIEAGEFAIRFEIKFESLAGTASASSTSAGRTSRAAFAAGVINVTALAGLT